MAYRELDNGTFVGKDLYGGTFTTQLAMSTDVAQLKITNWQKNIYKYYTVVPVRVTSSIIVPVTIRIPITVTLTFHITGGSFVTSTAKAVAIIDQGQSIYEAFKIYGIKTHRPETFEKLNGQFIPFERRNGDPNHINNVVDISTDYNFNLAEVVPDHEQKADYGNVSDFGFEFTKRLGQPVDNENLPSILCRIELHQLRNRKNPLEMEFMQTAPIVISNMEEGDARLVYPYDATKAEIYLESDVSDGYRRLYSIKDGEVKLKYYEDAELFYEGFSVSGLYSETYYRAPYQSKLTFSDGTNLLNILAFQIPLRTVDFATNFRVTLYEVFKYILREVLESECPMLVQDRLFYRASRAIRQGFMQLEVDVRGYQGLSCAEVIKRICGSFFIKFHKTIVTVGSQKACYWMISRASEKEENFFVRYTFSEGEDILGERNISVGNTIWVDDERNPVEAYHVNPSSSERGVSQSYDSIEITKKLANTPDLIEFPNFTEDAWERRSEDPDNPATFEFARRLKEWKTNGTLGGDNIKGYIKGQYPLPPYGPRAVVLLYNQTQKTEFQPTDNPNDRFREDEEVYLQHKGIEVIAGAKNFVTIEVDGGGIMDPTALSKEIADIYNQRVKLVEGYIPVEISQEVGEDTYVYSAESRTWNKYSGNPDIDRQININDFWELELPKVHYFAEEQFYAIDGEAGKPPTYLYNLTISSIPVQYDGTLYITIYSPQPGVIENLDKEPIELFIGTAILLRCDIKYHTENDLATFEEKTLAQVLDEDNIYSSLSKYEIDVYHTDNEDRGSVSAITWNGEPVLGFGEQIHDIRPIQEYLAKYFLSRYRSQDRIRKVNVQVLDLLNTMTPETLVATDDAPDERYRITRWSYIPVNKYEHNIWDVDFEEVKVLPVAPLFTLVSDKRSGVQQRGGGGGAFVDQTQTANISYLQPDAQSVEDDYVVEGRLANNELILERKQGAEISIPGFGNLGSEITEITWEGSRIVVKLANGKTVRAIVNSPDKYLNLVTRAGNNILFQRNDGAQFFASGVYGQSGASNDDYLDRGTLNGSILNLYRKSGALVQVFGFPVSQPERQDRFLQRVQRSGNAILFTMSDNVQLSAVGVYGQSGPPPQDRFLQDVRRSGNAIVFTMSDNVQHSVGGVFGQSGGGTTNDIHVSNWKRQGNNLVLIYNTGGSITITGVYGQSGGGTTDTYINGYRQVGNYLVLTRNGSDQISIPNVFGQGGGGSGTDDYATSGTYSNGVITIRRIRGGSFNITGLPTGSGGGGGGSTTVQSYLDTNIVKGTTAAGTFHSKTISNGSGKTTLLTISAIVYIDPALNGLYSVSIQVGGITIASTRQWVDASGGKLASDIHLSGSAPVTTATSSVVSLRLGHNHAANPTVTLKHLNVGATRV